MPSWQRRDARTVLCGLERRDCSYLEGYRHCENPARSFYIAPRKTPLSQSLDAQFCKTFVISKKQTTLCSQGWSHFRSSIAPESTDFALSCTPKCHLTGTKAVDAHLLHSTSTLAPLRSTFASRLNFLLSLLGSNGFCSLVRDIFTLPERFSRNDLPQAMQTFCSLLRIHVAAIRA